MTNLTDLAKHPNYNPNKLFDYICNTYNLKNDAALAKFLNTAPPVISKIRYRKFGISDSLILMLHETTNLPTREIKAILGVVTKPQPILLSDALERAKANSPGRPLITTTASSLANVANPD